MPTRTFVDGLPSQMLLFAEPKLNNNGLNICIVKFAVFQLDGYLNYMGPGQTFQIVSGMWQPSQSSWGRYCGDTTERDGLDLHILDIVGSTGGLLVQLGEWQRRREEASHPRKSQA